MDIELSRAYPETWKAMAALAQKGKTRYIGKKYNIRPESKAHVVPAKPVKLQGPQDSSYPRGDRNPTRREPDQSRPEMCSFR